jgi:hypothetical protein
VRAVTTHEMEAGVHWAAKLRPCSAAPPARVQGQPPLNLPRTLTCMLHIEAGDTALLMGQAHSRQQREGIVPEDDGHLQEAWPEHLAGPHHPSASVQCCDTG